MACGALRVCIAAATPQTTFHPLTHWDAHEVDRLLANLDEFDTGAAAETTALLLHVGHAPLHALICAWCAENQWAFVSGWDPTRALTHAPPTATSRADDGGSPLVRLPNFVLLARHPALLVRVDLVGLGLQIRDSPQWRRCGPLRTQFLARAAWAEEATRRRSRVAM
jgi:hypothetical protein